MKLTEAKLKNLILEVLNENRSNAEKIFKMIRPQYGEATEEQYNQAVMLTAFSNTLNDVISLWDDHLEWLMQQGAEHYCSSPGGYYAGYKECIDNVIREAESEKQKFINDVAKEISSKTFSDYRSAKK